MTDESAEFPALAQTLPEASGNGSFPGSADGTVPAPLRGCLYCHTEGATALGEGRKVLGLGGGTVLTCQHCGAVAQFEPGEKADQWRIRYRSVNHSARYYYVWLHLGQAGWLDAQTALEESRRGFVQRIRLQQLQRGDLAWLHPAPLASPPSLMSPNEVVYAMLNPASLHQGSKNGRSLSRGDSPMQDAGRFYLTDRKLHLLGHRRDWSHKLVEVQRVDNNDRYWRAYIGANSQYYQGENLPGQLDAQLFAAIIRALTKRD
ncbi:MAG: hypothetical protein ACYDBJ_21190 [Aggregatilineales bacterium]